MCFRNLEKACGRVNRGALWQILRTYDMGGKLLNGIKGIYITSLEWARVKDGESESFRTDIVVGQGSIMSPWLLNVYLNAVMKEVKGGRWRVGE